MVNMVPNTQTRERTQINIIFYLADHLFITGTSSINLGNFLYSDVLQYQFHETEVVSNIQLRTYLGITLGIMNLFQNNM